LSKCRTYNKRVQVQQSNATADAHGHVDETDESNWDHYTSTYAAVQTKGGREFWKVDQVAADVSHVWMCPWSETLAAATPKMRVVYDSQNYEILSVIDIDEAHNEIEIQTRRAV